MCGRYGRRADKQRIAEWFHTHNTDVFYNDTFGLPSFNVAPSTFQPIVRLNKETGEREIAYLRWGLVPFWAKDQRVGYSTINAKAETVTTSPTFREAMKSRRCLVPAEFFYEWQKIDAKRKQPYAIGMRNGSMFAFAGLWEQWKDKTSGNVLETFTVITTDPNELLEKIHTRMPVILKPQDYDRWLQPGDPQRLPVDLLRPYPAELMKAWKVSSDVGNVKNDRPDLCIESLVGDDGEAAKPEPKKGEKEHEQGGLFD